MSKKNNIQDERRRLMSEIFDLYDTEHTGYVDIKESLKMLSAIGRKLEPEHLYKDIKEVCFGEFQTIFHLLDMYIITK